MPGPTAKLDDAMGQVDFRSVIEMYDTFVDKERSDNPTFDFWSSYINMAQDLICLLRERERAIGSSTLLHKSKLSHGFFCL